MKKNNHFLTRAVILAAVFLLAVNGFLGTLLTNQSGEALRTQIRARMLDVSESAAALLDGDELERLTAEDEASEPYQNAMDTLRAFQEHVDLAYIYCIRDMGDGTFTFTIDPTVKDPAEFGEPVEYTDALHAASLGTSALDDTAYEDRWGRFYSAYSPVFNSEGRVAGIVGVDFEASWYERQIERHRNTVFVVGALSLLMGALIVLLITGRLRKRFLELNTEMNSLAEDMQELSRELHIASGRRWDGAEEQRGKQHSLDSIDVIEELNGMVHEVREEMREYIADAHALAYTDALTGVGNRTAYFSELDRLNRQFGGNAEEFSVAVFDINGLKKVNDERGHEYGDKLIIDAAHMLEDTFQSKSIYRIGGDEFVAVLEHVALDDVKRLFTALDQNLADLNLRRDPPLSLSKGAAACRKGEDREFNEVFRRADEAMYKDKAKFYTMHGDRRSR